MTLKHREWLVAGAFLAPNLIGISIFVVIPVFASLYLSFTQWDMLTPPEWIGVENYVNLANDPLFWLSLRNTLVYALIVIPVGTVVSLALALALNTRISGSQVYRTLFFLPYVSSTVAIGLIWKWVYQPDFGILNVVISNFGLPKSRWLSDPELALVSVAIVAIWQSAGYNMVIFLAGLKSIPSDFYEVASIDGASWLQSFRFITLPLLMPTTFFVLVTSLITSFQVFNLVFVMTEGGPGNATLVYVYQLWRNAFTFFKMGYASAMAFVLFIIMLVITLMQGRLLGRWISYELT